MVPCTHPLCALIDDGCRIAIQRSRGCHANHWPAATAPAVLAEARALLAALDRDAAIRLAQLVRTEALEQRSLATQLADEDEALGAALARLCASRS